MSSLLPSLQSEIVTVTCTGARLVISHPQGRAVLQQQGKQFPDIIVANLPDKTTLQRVAADHSFEMTEFEDEPGFYLAVLKFIKANNEV